MKKKLLTGLLGIGILATPCISQANFDVTTVIDTGSSYNNWNNYQLFWSNQSLATGFQLGQDSIIWDIHAIIGTFVQPHQLFSMSLYSSDQSGLPSDRLYTQQIFSPDDPSPTWVGLSGLYWSVPAGHYYAVFEDLPGESFHGVYYGNALYSLNDYAIRFGNSSSPWYKINNDILSTLRVMTRSKDYDPPAPAAPVPEPATMLLLGTGLVGISTVTRRRTTK